MGMILLVLAIIAALLAIVSGVWVASALISAIFVRRPLPAAPSEENDNSGEFGLNTDRKGLD